MYSKHLQDLDADPRQFDFTNHLEVSAFRPGRHQMSGGIKQHFPKTICSIDPLKHTEKNYPVSAAIKAHGLAALSILETTDCQQSLVPSAIPWSAPRGYVMLSGNNLSGIFSADAKTVLAPKTTLFQCFSQLA